VKKRNPAGDKNRGKKEKKRSDVKKLADLVNSYKGTNTRNITGKKKDFDRDMRVGGKQGVAMTERKGEKREILITKLGKTEKIKKVEWVASTEYNMKKPENQYDGGVNQETKDREFENRPGHPIIYSRTLKKLYRKGLEKGSC